MHIQASTCNKVVKIYDLYERKSSYLLVMEKPPNCIDLFEYSRKNGALDEKMAKKIFYQVVEACIDMQKKEVLHRDIKDENILLNEKTNQIKIIDFGCATEFDPEKKYQSFSGTPEFFPPEVFKEKNYFGESMTVWSLGTLLYVLLLGDIPYETTDHIIHNKPKKFSIEESNLSSKAQILLGQLLSFDASKRPSLQNILRSDWLQ